MDTPEEHKRICSIHELDLTPHHPVYPSPPDWRDEFIYFLLVDRFDDEHDYLPYDGTRGTRSTDDTGGRPFQGGTLRGVARRLPYLRGLGVTTLWLSPIAKNRNDPADNTYHGYAIQDFLTVDPRLGTLKDLQELVIQAHQLDMRVILDIVINHTGDNWAYKDDSTPLYRSDGTRYEFGFWRSMEPNTPGPEDAVWPAELQSPECYKRRGSIVNWNDLAESRDGDFANLKELDFGNPTVQEVMQAVYKYWIAVADIDGYRIDTVKHVEDVASTIFCNAIKEYATSIGKHNFFLFGEIVADDATLRSYVGPRTHNGSKLLGLDACLDFPLYFVLEEVLKGFANPHLLRERYTRLQEFYPASDASDYFVTFVDNHDQMARPHRRFLHDVRDQKQGALALAYLLTTPGIPCIYYGTEQGFDGGAPPGPYHDTFIRECMFGGKWGAFGTTGMHFFDETHALYRAIAQIAHARNELPALRYGRFYFREVSDNGQTFFYPALGSGVLAYARILDDTEVVIALNIFDREEVTYITVDSTLSPSGTLMKDVIGTETTLVESHAEHTCLRVTLPPYGVCILSQEKS